MVLVKDVTSVLNCQKNEKEPREIPGQRKLVKKKKTSYKKWMVKLYRTGHEKTGVR